MYICICNAVTENAIKQEIQQGACTLYELCKRLKVGDCCGCCQDDAKQILEKSLTLDDHPQNAT